MDLDSVTRGLWDHPRGKFSIDRQAWRYRKIRATGSEHIQPKEALRNLAEVSEAFRSEGVDSWLINGTLLGVVRDGHLIPHDSDTDVGVMSHNPAAIRRSLLRCINKGFAIIRVTQRGDGISLMRKDEYMDISLYRRRRIFFLAIWSPHGARPTCTSTSSASKVCRLMASSSRFPIVQKSCLSSGTAPIGGRRFRVNLASATSHPKNLTALFDQLPERLLIFFTCASGDSGWMGRHPRFSNPGRFIFYID